MKNPLETLYMDPDALQGVVQRLLRRRINLARFQIKRLRELYCQFKEHDGCSWVEFRDFCDELRNRKRIGISVSPSPRFNVFLRTRKVEITILVPNLSETITIDGIKVIFEHKNDRAYFRRPKLYRRKVRIFRDLIRNDRFWLQPENTEKLAALIHTFLHISRTFTAQSTLRARRFVPHMIGKLLSKDSDIPSWYQQMFLYILHNVKGKEVDLRDEIRRYPCVLDAKVDLLEFLLDVGEEDEHGRIMLQMKHLDPVLRRKLAALFPDLFSAYPTFQRVPETDLLAKVCTIGNLDSLVSSIRNMRDQFPQVLQQGSGATHSWGWFLFAVSFFCTDAKIQLFRSRFARLLPDKVAADTFAYCVSNICGNLLNSLVSAPSLELNPFTTLMRDLVLFKQL